MLSKFINHIKSIGILWIVIIFISFAMEVIGIIKYFETHNSIDLWAWGLISFIVIYLESIFIKYILDKEYGKL